VTKYYEKKIVFKKRMEEKAAINKYLEVTRKEYRGNIKKKT
jgi:hypothetical protein